MSASDFQVLIAPVIGTVSAIVIGLVSLYFTLRQERRYSRARAAPGTKTAKRQQSETAAAQEKQLPAPAAHY